MTTIRPAREIPETPLLQRLEESFRSHEGRLTSELVQSPGQFGLGRLPTALQATDVTTSVCGFCSTGCGLDLHLRDGQAVGLSPAVDYPVNLGTACPKGWEALSVLDSPNRGTTPLLCDAHGIRRPVDWTTAMRAFRERFQDIQRRHGPESVAFLSTGQIPTEEMLFLGALAKFGMGFVHGDSNTRQCMATAAVAYKQSFGFDAPPFTYADFELSDVLVFVGANPCTAHPIMWQRVLNNRRKPEIVVVDPRRTETAQNATLHLPINPKSDLALFYGVANELIARGRIDRSFIDTHTSDFDAFAAHVAAYPKSRVLAETGLDVAAFDRFVELLSSDRAVSFWWTMGVNQSYDGVRTAQSLINLALMTGNMGKPGTGANSITGQCNAMGSRLYSNTSALIGGRDWTNDAHRREVSQLLGVGLDRFPADSGLCYDQILDAVDAGKIRGLWIIATNTAHSWINQSSSREILGTLDFLVVQDMYQSTDTARLADLYLPAAGWGEKEGTFINSERRIGLTKKAVRAPGAALADFSIFRLIAEEWGCGEPFTSWNSPEAVFRVMQEASRGRPCDITGIHGYRELDEQGGIQWPYPEGTTSAPRERRLFADGCFFHADRRAKFLFTEPQRMPEPPDNEFPYVLLTGRGSVAQWHTQTRTAQSAVLRKLYPERAYVEIHPDDADRLGVRTGQSLTIESRRGSATVAAYVVPTVRAGQVFMPMHYACTNRLTLPHFDTYSRQPSYKDCAVRLSVSTKEPEL